MPLLLVQWVTAGCPRETESHFYGGHPVRKPFGDARPATQQAPAEGVSPEGDQGGPPSGVLEGASQPSREDKAPVQGE